MLDKFLVYDHEMGKKTIMQVNKVPNNKKSNEGARDVVSPKAP